MQNDALTKNICEFSVENIHTSASVHQSFEIILFTSNVFGNKSDIKQTRSARRRGELQAQFKC